METGETKSDEMVLTEIAAYMGNSDKQMIDKLNMHLELMNRWIYIRNLGLDLKSYFDRNGFQKVAIYGMAELGCRFLEELERLRIQVSYCVDQKPLGVSVRNRLRVITPNEDWEQDVDVIVVTAVFYFDELKNMIHDKVSCPVVSLKEIIWQI